MIRRRHPVRQGRQLVLHLTTADISLSLLLGPQLRAFQLAGYDVLGVSAPGPFVGDIEALGVRFLPLRNATRSMSLAADLRSALELWYVIRAERPDIVHTHNPKPGVYGRVVAGLAGVPVVVNTVHGLYATKEDPARKRMVVYLLERLAACFSDAELVQNPEDLRTLRSLGVPDHRLHLLGNGVDLRRFAREAVSDETRRRIRAEWGADDDSVVIMSAGRLVREKGFPELFAAAVQVKRTDPRAIFVVAGPPDPAKQDGLTSDELQVAEDSGIRLLGHRRDVEALYAASDIFVLASHREGYPRSAMEASAMGLPVVATDIRGCREVVEHGLTGLLVPVRDERTLGEAIASLVGDPARRQDMGQAAAIKAKNDFDQEAVIARTLAVYERLLRTSRRSSRGRIVG